MLYEIRRYQAKPGMRDEWVRFFEGTVAPFQRSKGAVIPGSFTDDQDENGFVWLRVFTDDAHRAAVSDAIHADENWTNNIAPLIPTMLVREETVITKVRPTPASELQ